MRDILLAHFNRYPKMQIQDMVKLIYQNEFAGGHMISDEKSSLLRIEEECRAYKKCRGAFPYSFEDIGNGICRFYLAGFQEAGIHAETLNRFFTNSANTIRGDRRRFERKLHVLKACCRDSVLPYDTDALDEYIGMHRQNGYPPVSHSDAYRKAYCPAYRVVRSVYRDFFDIFSRIDALLGKQDFVCVAIDGRSGAGKSTLSELIGDVYRCNVFHMDHFFLRPEQRTRARLSEIGGNVDYERFAQEVMTPLMNRRDITFSPYVCKTQTLSTPISVQKNRLNIIEGVYSMHPTLVDNYDLKIVLDINTADQSDRILHRSGHDMHKRFMDEWIPMENRYFEHMRIQEQCDLYYNVSDLS